ncbi:hypothetical protein B4U37_09825 [Sutcliffiella horikoshii]|uniref:Uncharacterized protein n=1 Tax=Sutcliffiella horikoshii TaxID=79883 RepID=A0ABM6KIK5_9BACI|nr:hypothetical protein B4U37_09825 [Sutcliffiella horikoshii]
MSSFFLDWGKSENERKHITTLGSFILEKYLLVGYPPLFLSAYGFAFRGTVFEPPHFVAGSQSTVTPPLESSPIAPIHS